MSEDTMLNEAIEAARGGDRSRARDLLTRLLRTDQGNAEYWLWMSSIVETPKEKIYCLKAVQRLDPDNRIAKRGLILLGASAPDATIIPVPPARKERWQVEEIDTTPKSPLARVLGNPIARIVIVISAAALLISLIGAGVIGVQRRREENQVQAFIRLTLAARPSPTLTVEPTLTPTPLFRTPTPTFARPTPLELLLESPTRQHRFMSIRLTRRLKRIGPGSGHTSAASGTR